MGYHYRRPRDRSGPGRNPRLELAVSAAVLLVVVALIALFLFVYHDFPLRTS